MKNFKQSELDRIVAQAGRDKQIHGLVLHVETRDKELSLSSAYGNLAIDSQYYIASINKLIISFLVLRFVQSGKISFDDRVSKFLNGQSLQGLMMWAGEDFSGELTVRHLLSHSSGLPCYLIDKGPDGKKNMDLILHGENQSWPMEKVFDFVKQVQPKFRPGAKGKASYSETNFRLLDLVLESLTGKPIPVLLQEVFEELGMTSSCVLPSHAANKLVPVFYKQRTIDISEYWKSTGHDIASTVQDQMRFARAFFDGAYFSDAFIEGLKDWRRIFFPFQYGIGIQKFYIPRIFSPFKAVPDFIGHCGSVGSVAFFVPEKQVYITGTINQAGSPNKVFQTMIKVVNKM
jgi:D-alanyl-D-alanine carboxypeptidase